MLTKGVIRKIALERLNQMGFKCWIQNNHATRGRKFIGEYGVGDISGWHRKTGIRLECEVKATGDVLSDEQKEFLTELRNASGHVYIAAEKFGKVIIYEY